MTDRGTVRGNTIVDGDLLAARLAAVAPLDETSMAAVVAQLDRLTKPPGSLGRLEGLAIQIAGITARPDASVDRRAIVIAAADHGVTRHGVSAYPSDVTAQMVANFVTGGAAINVLAIGAGAAVTVLDVGVASPIAEPEVSAPAGRLRRSRVRDGTADMTVGPAMRSDEARRAIEEGATLVDDLVDDGLEILGVGEMGIGNTTAASAMTAILTRTPIEDVTGRGTGIDDATHARKVEVIRTAILVNDPDPDDPLGVLATVGGLEIAALVGMIVAAAGAQIPIVLDGFITGVAALVATALQPAIAPRLIASHRSVEPGHAVILDRLGLAPLLELDLRLGEGSGAALALPLVGAAVAIRDGMATFQDAGVSGPRLA